ncbi:phage tail tip fiber protein [Pseudomonas oryzihabitans]|uniref:phage tail tip fiber protein n=1 Tax=Pseudomonas oryzihabitans TaxID=47885 RepID=UPI000AC816C7|nr:DUF1983 domain-containing protein [Pseudomonas psychrotolerans]
MSQGVGKIGQVAIGAAIGFMQGGPWGAVIGAGLALYSANQQEKLAAKSNLRESEPSAQTVRSSKAPARYILGRVSTGGVLAWAQEQGGADADGEWLHLVYVLSEGEIDGLEAVFLGEENINTFADQASFELIVNPSQVNTFLKTYCPDWKDSQIGRGLSFVRLSLRYSAEKFPSGLPDVRFVVRGRRDIYDPRSGASIYTENTALHLLWFLRNRCHVPDDEIVFETFASAANVCDETVDNPDRTSSGRYRTGCVIGADESRTQVLQKLEASCAGQLIRVGGRWMLQAGAYYGPSDFTITEDMVIGTVSGTTEPSNDAVINTVRGTFIDPKQSWTETDYPEVVVAEWVLEDGGEAAETLTFSYVNDPYQAQRLANIELRRRRAGGTINLPMNFAGYNCRPGRVVRLDLPSLNMAGEFIVSDWSMGTQEGCTVSLQQYEAAIFDDAVGTPYNPIGFINLPAGGLGSPTGLTWVADGSSEVVQGVLSWTRPNGIVTGYAVTVRQGTTVVQALQLPETAVSCPLSGLPSGSYTMSVAAIGPLARSGEVTITVSIGGPPIPESCAVYADINSITLVPANPRYGLNGGTYEFYFTTDPQGAAKDADYLGQGLTFTHTGLAFSTAYFYFVRSRNAYGVSAFLKVNASTSTDVTAYLAALAGQIGRTQLGQDLLAPIDKIPVIESDLAQERSDRAAAIVAEQQARQSGLQQEASARAADLAAEAAARNQALINEATIRQAADEQMSSRIQGVYAQVNPPMAGGSWSAGSPATYAGVWSEQFARAQGDAAEALARDTLSAQLRGGYTGTDPNQVTSGLIYQERRIRLSAEQALSQQISLVSAGVGEQFDSGAIWYFDSGIDGWTGNGTPTAAGGFLRPANAALASVYSPAGLAVNADTYRQVRFRIRRTGSPSWNGRLYWGDNWANSMAIEAPTFDVNGISTVILNLSWTGTVGQIRLDLGSQGAADFYELDWVAIGRASPGASYAALSAEQTARASADQALAQDISTLTARVVDPKTGNAALSTAVDNLTGRADNTEAGLSAVTTRVSGIYAQVNPPLAGANDWYAGSPTVLAGVYSEQYARAEGDNALGKRIDTVTASTAGNAAAITAEQTARATADSAMAQRIDTVQAATGDNKALIQAEQTARSNADSALANRIDTVQATANNAAALVQAEQTARVDADSALGKRVDTVQASLGTTNASVQQISQAQAATDNKVNASYQIKLQVTADGKYYAAGMGIGIENTDAGTQSQILFQADRFALINSGQLVTPFVVQNGQVLINEAFIQKATIQNAIVGSVISSQAFTQYGQRVMDIDFNNGAAYFRSYYEQGTETQLNRDGIRVYGGNVLVVELGRLS